METPTQFLTIHSNNQQMHCYERDMLWGEYTISTATNGLGEENGSERTPRGWHKIHSIIGRDNAVNSVFVARQWTGEIYNEALADQYKKRDWILTRILRLEGIEPGRNQGGNVDSLNRYIYIHGTPDTTVLGKPGSRGCIRMANKDIIELADWIKKGACVHID